MTLFVGNLSDEVISEDLERLFQRFSPVMLVQIVRDPVTCCPRGFGFVEVHNQVASVAIRKLHGHFLRGRRLKVEVARPRAHVDGSWQRQSCWSHMATYGCTHIWGGTDNVSVAFRQRMGKWLGSE